MVFFNRGGRRPEWMDTAEGVTRAPVVIESQPRVAELLLARLETDVERRRSVAAFEISIDGTPYQVIAQLVYNDVVRDDLQAIVGFTVNLPWVRKHYFPEITQQVARIVDARGGASLAVLDERGTRVAGALAPAGSPTIRRPFSLLFLDPLLVAVDRPDDLPVHEWAVEVAVVNDASPDDRHGHRGPCARGGRPRHGNAVSRTGAQRARRARQRRAVRNAVRLRVHRDP